MRGNVILCGMMQSLTAKEILYLSGPSCQSDPEVSQAPVLGLMQGVLVFSWRVIQTDQEGWHGIEIREL